MMIDFLCGFAAFLVIITGIALLIGIPMLINSGCECRDIDYGHIDDWVNEYPELHSDVHEALSDDNEISNWEWYFIKREYKELETSSRVRVLHETCLEKCNKMCLVKEKKKGTNCDR